MIDHGAWMLLQGGGYRFQKGVEVSIYSNEGETRRHCSLLQSTRNHSAWIMLFMHRFIKDAEYVVLCYEIVDATAAVGPS